MIMNVCAKFGLDRTTGGDVYRPTLGRIHTHIHPPNPTPTHPPTHPHARTYARTHAHTHTRTHARTHILLYRYRFLRIIPRIWFPLEAVFLHCSENLMFAFTVTPKSLAGRPRRTRKCNHVTFISLYIE